MIISVQSITQKEHAHNSNIERDFRFSGYDAFEDNSNLSDGNVLETWPDRNAIMG